MDPGWIALIQSITYTNLWIFLEHSLDFLLNYCRAGWRFLKKMESEQSTNIWFEKLIQIRNSPQQYCYFVYFQFFSWEIATQIDNNWASNQVLLNWVLWKHSKFCMFTHRISFITWKTYGSSINSQWVQTNSIKSASLIFYYFLIKQCFSWIVLCSSLDTKCPNKIINERHRCERNKSKGLWWLFPCWHHLKNEKNSLVLMRKQNNLYVRWNYQVHKHSVCSYKMCFM